MFIDFKSIQNMTPNSQGTLPESHVNQFQIDQNMAPKRTGLNPWFHVFDY